MINRVSPEPVPVTAAKLALFRAVSAAGTADTVIGSKCGSCDEHVRGSGAQGWLHFCVVDFGHGHTEMGHCCCRAEVGIPTFRFVRFVLG